MTRSLLGFCLVIALLVTQARAQGDRVVYEATINASVEKVWQAFTTAEGLRSWMAPLAEIELKVGGLMRSNYNPQGQIGDATTITNTILAFDPHRMLALKATSFPAGFPFEEAAKQTWSVFYFEDIGEGRTKLTIVGLGYGQDEQSRQMRAFFEQGNPMLIGQLRKVVEPKPAE